LNSTISSKKGRWDMQRAEKEVFVQSIGRFVARAVSDAVAPLQAEIIDLRSKLASQPTPRDGKDAEVDYDRIARDVLAQLPTPEAKEPDPVDYDRIKADVLAELPKPVDGKDADPELVRQMVTEAVAVLPPAAPGKDAEPVDYDRIVAEVVKQIPAPENGKDADPDEIRRLVGEAVAALPAAEKGDPGKDADPEETAELVQRYVQAEGAVILARLGEMVPEAVKEAVHPEVSAQLGFIEATREPIDYQRIIKEAASLIPAPQNGQDADPEEVRVMVAEEVARAVSGLPAPKDGVDGRDAAQMVAFVKDQVGSLIVTLSDGRVIETGIRDGRDGVDGKDGNPGPTGLGFDDIDVTVGEDGRTIVLALERDDLRQSFELALPVWIYRGIYEAERAYERGDVVTWGRRKCLAMHPRTGRSRRSAGATGRMSSLRMQCPSFKSAWLRSKNASPSDWRWR
jgi:hypothetical protein